MGLFGKKYDEMDLTKYFESKTEKKVTRNKEGYEKLD
jgi:hypothetical protein